LFRCPALQFTDTAFCEHNDEAITTLQATLREKEVQLKEIETVTDQFKSAETSHELREAAVANKHDQCLRLLPPAPSAESCEEVHTYIHTHI
jgi:hypothetical protein